jgi:hypothetical protein
MNATISLSLVSVSFINHFLHQGSINKLKCLFFIIHYWYTIHCTFAQPSVYSYPWTLHFLLPFHVPDGPPIFFLFTFEDVCFHYTTVILWPQARP